MHFPISIRSGCLDALKAFHSAQSRWLPSRAYSVTLDETEKIPSCVLLHFAHLLTYSWVDVAAQCRQGCETVFAPRHVHHNGSDVRKFLCSSTSEWIKDRFNLMALLGGTCEKRQWLRVYPAGVFVTFFFPRNTRASVGDSVTPLSLRWKDSGRQHLAMLQRKQKQEWHSTLIFRQTLHPIRQPQWDGNCISSVALQVTLDARLFELFPVNWFHCAVSAASRQCIRR